MKEFLISLLNFFGLAVWVEMATENPNCTYYFGPFLTLEEAQTEQQGYVEDLESENSTVVQVIVKRCNPSKLTVSEPGETLLSKRMTARFSTQS